MATYKLIVNNVDNHLVVDVNGSQIYNNSKQGDNEINDTKLFTDFLMPASHPNLVNVYGYNFKNDAVQGAGSVGEGNPWHFNYKIEKSDGAGTVIIASNNVSGPDTEVHPGEKLVFQTQHTIIKE